MTQAGRQPTLTTSEVVAKIAERGLVGAAERARVLAQALESGGAQGRDQHCREQQPLDRGEATGVGDRRNQLGRERLWLELEVDAELVGDEAEQTSDASVVGVLADLGDRSEQTRRRGSGD